VKSYTVRRAEETIPLTGAAEGPWTDAEVAVIDEFN
jgi:hypothetical protein